jgi:two-component system, NtrC family, sensor kinase
LFLNTLSLNAIQSIENTGTIEITTLFVEDKNHFEITISDSGSGIPPGLLQKIFDPFFTTKPVGMGTGLGLSISHGIVSDHNGEIRIASEPGKGSRFTIVLPKS